MTGTSEPNPVISPVRWWRDDATRYVTRGPQIVPAAQSAEWAFELLRPSDPDIARRLDEMHTAVWGHGPLAELFDPWGDRAMREGRSIADPIADLRAFLDDQRREIDRINRSKP